MQGKKQRYFLLNIKTGKKGKKKNKVEYWIKTNKFAPIFFDGHTIEHIKNKTEVSYPKDHHNSKPHKHEDAETFVKTFSNFPTTDDIIVFSIGKDKIYFFKQAAELVPFNHNEKDKVKGFPITEPKEVDIKNCPLVLANIKANRHFSSGTFKEVRTEYSGNIQAIKYLLYKNAEVSNFPDYLECLSSLEFETLIAKILEEKGFFVPAYKGGCIENFDLVCKNFGEIPIEIGKEKIKSGDIKLIQIKLKLRKKDYKEDSNYLYFCIKSYLKENTERVFVADDIEKLLDKSRTYDWLRKSLYWVQFVKNVKRNNNLL